MMKIAICDDSKNDIDNICSYLNNMNIDCTIETFNDASILLTNFINKNYEVVLLDIDMPNMTGFELAAKLKEINYNIIIVFITYKTQLIFESFKYRPISFINKNNLFELDNIFDDIVYELELMNPYFIFTKDSVKTNISYDDILYFKKSLNNVEIHTTTQVIEIRDSLKKIESIIQSTAFIHLSKSIYLNASYVLHIDYANLLITLKNGEHIQFSRLYKKHIKALLC